MKTTTNSSISTEQNLSDTFQTILFKTKAEKKGQSWLGNCPCHDDKKASLSITKGDDGRILLNCFANCDFESIVTTMGFQMADMFPPKKPAPCPEIKCEYNYRADDGSFLFQAVRFEPKGFSQRRRDDLGNWVWGLSKGLYAQSQKGDWYLVNNKTPADRPQKEFPEVRRVLYRLPELLADESDGWVFVPEGEKDCENLRTAGLIATTNPQGAGKWRPEFNSYFKGRKVCILPDNDPPPRLDPETKKLKKGYQGQKHAVEIYDNLKSIAECAVILELASLKEKCDVSDWLKSGGTRDELLQLADRQAADLQSFDKWLGDYRKRISQEPESEGNKSAKSKKLDVIELATQKATFFHDDDNQQFASAKVGSWIETYPVSSKNFRIWLSGIYWQATGTALYGEAFKDALATLQAIAQHEGEERNVFLRLAENGGNLYLDLCDREWRVVEITPDDWRVISSTEAPVRFVRRPAMQALPVPVKGGSVNELRKYLNVEDETWTLIINWLVMAFHPSGPYPILSVCGEQGSAKSTACKMLRSLVDPNKADLRAVPSNERDLMIAASNSWLLGYDNLSSMSQELGDSLCRVATGAGFSTKANYTDNEETIFSVKRPIITNGIADVANFPDLLERAVAVYLLAIPPDKRRDEDTLWSEFNVARPSILGAVLTAVSCALKRRRTVKLAVLPRMADFSIWATAAAPALGLADDAFTQTYDSNHSAATDQVLETSPALEICEFMFGQESDTWQGQPSALLKALKTMLNQRGEEPNREFPKSASQLTTKVRRAAKNLRDFGLDARTGKTNGKRKITLLISKSFREKFEKRSALSALDDTTSEDT